MSTEIIKPKQSIVQLFQSRMQDRQIPVSPYAIRCINSACETMTANGINITDPKYKTDILQIFSQINQTELNTFSRPDECTIVMYGPHPKLQIIGEGNIKIKRKFGVNVKEIRPSWIVKEGDEFTPPHFKGIEVVPPEWTPKGISNKVFCVCTPVIYLDNSVEYFVAYRNAVKVSLLAFINKEKNHGDLVNKYADSKYSVDDILAQEELKPILKNAYGSANVESMIATKLKIKSVANIPVDFTKSYDSKELQELAKNALDAEDDRGIVSPVYSVEDDEDYEPSITTNSIDTSSFENKSDSNDKEIKKKDLPF